MRQAWDATTTEALGKVLKTVVAISAILVMMQSFGLSISGVLAFGGVGGIAVGFAAKDLLANFFGGLMIYMDRQFAVGDWIRSPDKPIEGTVEHIGWRVTRIRTFDMRPLYVPNATFTNITVENPSRMTNRRFYETFGLRYQDRNKLADITTDIKNMLLQHDAIDTGQTLMVNLNTLNQHSVDFFVYCFTKTTRWAEFHGYKQALLQAISDIVDKHGAAFAFPTQTVLLQQSAATSDTECY
jgi:MscS family membrane protein